RHLNRVLTRSLQFQRPDPADADAAIIRRYRLLYDAYFEEQPLIPEDQFHEIAFEELERDPMGQVQLTYEALGLDGYNALKPRLEDYVATLTDYKKNEYAELSAELRRRIGNEWRRSFEAWGYPLD